MGTATAILLFALFPLIFPCRAEPDEPETAVEERAPEKVKNPALEEKRQAAAKKLAESKWLLAHQRLPAVSARYKQLEESIAGAEDETALRGIERDLAPFRTQAVAGAGLGGVDAKTMEKIRVSQEAAVARMEARRLAVQIAVQEHKDFVKDRGSAQTIPAAAFATEFTPEVQRELARHEPPAPIISPHGDTDNSVPMPFATATQVMKTLGGLFIAPVQEFGKITENHGWRRHPILGGKQNHPALDLTGDGVIASRAGKVVKAGWNAGYGKHIEIEHGDGSTTTYSHLSDIPFYLSRAASNPVMVEQGQFIGEVGSTGLSTAKHLHFSLCLRLGGCSSPDHFTDPRVYISLPECPPEHCKPIPTPSSVIAQHSRRRRPR
ncbi:MAG: M23 family metallopeptidase [Elusimicrobia bacterium]|nr:M23 family metallopeptidase [Elusimicrobiota bacterium]